MGFIDVLPSAERGSMIYIKDLKEFGPKQGKISRKRMAVIRVKSQTNTLSEMLTFLGQNCYKNDVFNLALKE